jgi:hypothetical protein
MFRGEKSFKNKMSLSVRHDKKLNLDVHANGQDNGGDAFPLQASLNGKGRLIMQNFLEMILLTEDQLSCKN